jgi:hypothetical protein
LSEPRKHHFISRFLLRGFAIPEQDDGRLFVLDHTRKKVFASSPANIGHRRDFNRVGKETHADPLVVEKFFADIEDRAAPVLAKTRATRQFPGLSEAAKVLDLIAIHLIRTPRFRKWMDGNLFKVFEQKILAFGRNGPSKRRFAQRQRSYGLPKECWTPEGYIAYHKNGQFSTTTDDNWKIAMSLNWLPTFVNVLQSRHWVAVEFPEGYEPLIISDNAVGFLPVGEPGPRQIGLARTDTILFLPITTRLVLVGIYPELRPMVPDAIQPRLLNTVSFAHSLDQCYSAHDDFTIYDEEKRSLQWKDCLTSGQFPKLIDDDVIDLADVYAGR